MFQERYFDVLSILRETEDELRNHRQRSVAIPCRSSSSDSLYYSSLASELETSDSGCYNTPMFSARCEASPSTSALPLHGAESLRAELSQLENAVEAPCSSRGFQN